MKAIANAKLSDIDRKIGELIGLRDMLRHLVKNCHGDSRPDCPIIEGLAGEQNSGFRRESCCGRNGGVRNAQVTSARMTRWLNRIDVTRQCG